MEALHDLHLLPLQQLALVVAVGLHLLELVLINLILAGILLNNPWFRIQPFRAFDQTLRNLIGFG
jgi:hypothetical protein